MNYIKNQLLYTLVHSRTCHHVVPHILFSASLQIGNLSFYTTEEQIHDVFSKCANPEDGGGVKRIIMGLDRHTRYAYPLPEVNKDLPDLGFFFPVQDALWFLFCRILYTRGSAREHAICIRYQT